MSTEAEGGHAQPASGSAGAPRLPPSPGAITFRRTLVTLSVLAAIGLAYLLRGVLVPLFFAFLLAYALDPFVDWLEARRIHRTLAAPVVMLLHFVRSRVPVPLSPGGGPEVKAQAAVSIAPAPLILIALGSVELATASQLCKLGCAVPWTVIVVPVGPSATRHPPVVPFPATARADRGVGRLVEA